MSMIETLLARAARAFNPPAQAVVSPKREAAGTLAEDEDGWQRLSETGGAASGARDLSPMSQERMQRLAEYLWQSNVLGNRLVEIPLAYLLAEGVRLECADEAHQALLDKFWGDPINNWAWKLYERARSLSLYGEQVYSIHRNEHTGFIRLGYVAPQRINQVVMDPDNPEQAIGVLTKKDAQGRYRKHRVHVAAGVEDAELFTARTVAIRAGFTDGDVLLFQVNKLADGSRGRSDLLPVIDWIDAYDEFLFGELDRTRYLRAFVWDLLVTGANAEEIQAKAKTFQPPAPNSVYVHNDAETLTAKAPELSAADSAEAARLFRNHALGGATIPESWLGGGGDVNRSTAGEMAEPTLKLFTARQTALKQMLEAIGRLVLASQPDTSPQWGTPEWQVTARFPELATKDITKLAAAMREVTTAALLLVDKGLLTEERALRLVSDVAGRFGQEIDAAEELKAARLEHRARASEQQEADAFTQPGQPGQAGEGEPKPEPEPAGAK